MSKSILTLPPALQAVWMSVYQAILTGNDSDRTMAHNCAEKAAWEAVRRANGGVMPEEHQTPAAETMREALLWFADEEHYEDTYRTGAGYVDACGLEKAREALGLPSEREDGSLMPLAEAVKCAPSESIVAREPTEEEMIEALAPIAAEAHYGAEWGRVKEDPPRLEAVLNNARLAVDNPDTLYITNGLSRCALAALASWKAARAWGKT